MPHNFDLELFPAFIAYKCLVPQIRSPISLRIILTFSNPMVNNQTMFSSVDFATLTASSLWSDKHGLIPNIFHLSK